MDLADLHPLQERVQALAHHELYELCLCLCASRLSATTLCPIPQLQYALINAVNCACITFACSCNVLRYYVVCSKRGIGHACLSTFRGDCDCFTETQVSTSLLFPDGV